VAKNQRVLVISDLHVPFHHADTLNFLKAIKEKYQPDRVICIGDEVDLHSLSFHEHKPDLMSPSDELKLAIEKLKYIYQIFPDVDVMESNHGSLVYRRSSANGLPRHVLKSYNDVLEAPKGWQWSFDLIIRLSNDQDCYFHHGKTSHHLQLSQSMGMNAVSGHFHEKFAINYWASPAGLFWQMSVGFLADHKSLALAYAQNNLKRGIVGVGIILDGHPRLLPMVLAPNGRWIKRLV
jgi:hypothetical protein